MGEDGFIPFRYQGQYEDEGTGVYYNRFRYYDPKMGRYTQVDPIGLAGGNPTVYGHVSNLNLWIDPLGLNNVIHFPDFDTALRKAYEIAMGGEANITFTATNFDPRTGTYVGFRGSNGSKIVFDSPHADMSAKYGRLPASYRC